MMRPFLALLLLTALLAGCDYLESAQQAPGQATPPAAPEPTAERAPPSEAEGTRDGIADSKNTAKATDSTRAIGNTPQPRGTIVAFGDSITAGYGVGQDEAYPAQLERLLREDGYDHTVINMGVSGDTSGTALERVDDVIAQDPDIVIIQIGANDAKALTDPDITRRNIANMTEELIAHNITVVLAGSPVVRIPQWDFPEAFTAIYPAIAEGYNLTYIPFFLEGVVGVAAANLDDGVHPAAAGHARIAQNTYPYALEAIGRAQEK